LFDNVKRKLQRQDSLINIPGALPAIFELTFNHSLAARQQPASFAVVFLINKAVFSDSFDA
jgi:hypothetical protein